MYHLSPVLSPHTCCQYLPWTASSGLVVHVQQHTSLHRCQDSLSSSALSNVQNNPTVQKLSTILTHHNTVDRNIKTWTRSRGSGTAVSCCNPSNRWRNSQSGGGRIQFSVGETIPGTCTCTMGDDVGLVTGVDVAPDREPKVSAAGLF